MITDFNYFIFSIIIDLFNNPSLFVGVIACIGTIIACVVNIESNEMTKQQFDWVREDRENRELLLNFETIARSFISFYKKLYSQIINLQDIKQIIENNNDNLCKNIKYCYIPTYINRLLFSLEVQKVFFRGYEEYSIITLYREPNFKNYEIIKNRIEEEIKKQKTKFIDEMSKILKDFSYELQLQLLYLSNNFVMSGDKGVKDYFLALDDFYKDTIQLKIFIKKNLLKDKDLIKEISQLNFILFKPFELTKMIW